MTTDSLATLIASGALPNLDSALWVREGTTEPSGMRVIDVAPHGGISLRLLPDRGLDVGQAWFRGTPLAWLSDKGECGPLDELDGMRWADAFGGGLMTTCGLRNVGMPSEGHGLHGTFSHLRASNVMIARTTDEHGAISVSGTIIDDTEPPQLRVERTITAWGGQGRIEVSDVTSNTGTEAADAPLLYHFNFGWPLWSGAASLDLDALDTVARDSESERALDRWKVPLEPTEGPEWVLEHRANAKGGRARARIENEDLALGLMISWNVDQLPIVNQWLDANPGMAVLGIEPANCTTRGRSFERARGTMPTIEPGGRRTTSVIVEAYTL